MSHVTPHASHHTGGGHERFDPLAALRRAGDPEVDILVCGTVLIDIVFSGLREPPRSGVEAWADGMGASPGGAATLAVACQRLGLHTALAATFGEDLYGDYCRQTLGIQEGVDLSYSCYVTGLHSAVTVSMVYGGDRARVTHGHPHNPPPQLHDPPSARACFVDLGAERLAWADTIAANGGLVFADLGWDPHHKWDLARLRDALDGCHAFSPNAGEAMSYTRTDSPEAALEALAPLVPRVVVTCGADGAIAHEQATGTVVRTEGVRVDHFDPTGAGDVFLAGLATGTLARWPLEHTVRLADLSAALSVRDFGGALAAPGWGEIATWWNEVAMRDPRLRERYGFLAALLPETADPAVARAVATVGFRATT